MTPCVAAILWLAAQAASGPEWRPVEGTPILQPDGRVVLQGALDVDGPEGPASWDPEVVLPRGRHVFLVDSEGVDWSLEHLRSPERRSVLVGRRGPEEVTRQALGTESRRILSSAEDRYGRRWFHAGGAAWCWDGEAWRSFDLTAPRGGLDRKVVRSRATEHARTSPDGERVFLACEQGPGFWVAEGGEPELTHVAPRHGSSAEIVRDLVPLDEGRVLIFPTLEVVGPGDWGGSSGSGGVRETGSRLDGLEFDFPAYLPGPHGESWFTAQSCRDAKGYALSTTDHPYVFRVHANGKLQRADAALEAFRPDHVGPDGTAWRWHGVPGLERLYDGRRFRLLDARSGEPVRMVQIEGNDRRGRLWIRLGSGGGWFVHDPSAGGPGIDADGPFRWELLPRHVWSAEDEAEALKLVRGLLLERDLDRANDIVERFAMLAYTARESLSHPELWGKLAGEILPQSTTGASPSRIAGGLGRAAQELRLFELSLEAYVESFQTAEHPTFYLARSVADAAVRLQEWNTALLYLEEVARLGRTWVRDDGLAQAELVRAVLAAPNEVRAHVAFAEGYWSFPNSSSWGDHQTARARDAVRFLSATKERFDAQLTTEQRIAIATHLQRWSWFALHEDGAMAWTERLVQLHAWDHEGAASALQALAGLARRARKWETADRCWRRLIARFPGTSAAELAAYEVGCRLQREGDPRGAIEVLASLVPASGGGGSRYARDAARRVSECYETLCRLEPALRYARLVQTLPDETFCGTGDDARRLADEARINRLEAALNEER